MDAEAVRQAGRTLQGCTVLRNADKVLPEDDNLLDNQDLCLLFKVSIKTLQRYRAIGAPALLHYQRKSVLQGFRCPGVY